MGKLEGKEMVQEEAAEKWDMWMAWQPCELPWASSRRAATILGDTAKVSGPASMNFAPALDIHDPIA
jgi:hypothetical protein